MTIRTSNLASLVLAAVLGVPAAASAQSNVAEAEALLQQADRILLEIEQYRGVPATGPVARAVQTRASLRDRLVDLIHDEYSPAELEAMQGMMVALQLLPPDRDYIELTLELLNEQIAGFYDDGEAVFYILDDMDPEMQGAVMAHELFHAIQDQVWTIAAVRGETKHLTDASLARTAVLEGDALAVMVSWMLGGAVDLSSIPMIDALLANATGDPSTMSDVDVPHVMWEQLLYPYTGGLTFVIAVQQAGGLDAVNALYVDPPSSTEQILHPDRYLDRDEPTWLTFDVEVPGGEIYAQDVFGELTLGATLAQLLDGRVSSGSCARAADGWDGDRAVFVRFDDAPDRHAVVHVSVWDDEDEAGSFARVAARLPFVWLGNDAERVHETGDHGEGWSFTAPSGAASVERWGDLVVVAVDHGGDATGRADALATTVEGVWSSLRRSQYPDLTVRADEVATRSAPSPAAAE